MSEGRGRVFMYMLRAASGVPVVWFWVRWHRYGIPSGQRLRHIITTLALVLNSLSWLVLVFGSDVAGHFAVRPGDPMDMAYIHAIQVGLLTSLLATILGAFAVKGMRVILSVAGTVLLCFWLIAAVAL